MKNFSLILNVLLVIIVLVFAVKITVLDSDKNTAPVAESVSKAEAAIDVIMTRSSVRAYTDQAVEKEKVEQMLKAAMAAPTGNNKQPWAFVVVDQRELLDELGSFKSAAAMLTRAPLAVVICGDMTKAATASCPEYWIQDCSAATENLLLAAHALDLGAVWVGVYPTASSVEAVTKTLSLPENLVPLNIISIGYPLGEGKPKDKWNPEAVFYNAF